MRVSEGNLVLTVKGSTRDGRTHRVGVVTTANSAYYSFMSCSPVLRDVTNGESIKLYLHKSVTQGIIGDLHPSKDDILVVKYVRCKPCKKLVPGAIVMRPDSGIPFVVTSANHKSFYARCLLTGVRSKFPKTVNMSSVKTKVMA